MAGIHFDITADNSHFIETIGEIQKSVRQTSDILEEVGKNFNVEGIENQVVSLTKVIQEQESLILRSKERIVKWLEEANDVRNAGETGTFEAIQKDIVAETQSMQKLIEETEKYKTALHEILTLNGQSQGVSAPMFFGSQDDFEAYEQLLRKREEIQSRIANFDGEGMTDRQQTARIVEMRSELTVLNAEINKTELAAAKAAQALGENGERASEAAVRYYELKKAVEEQVAKINDLQLKLNSADEKLNTAVGVGDVEGARDAQVEYDSLAESLKSAKMELINLQTEEKKASEDFKEYGDTTESLRMQLRECTMELTALTLQYRKLSDEEKNSSKGQEIRKHMEELSEQAGELRDTLGDVQKAISANASDTRMFDSLAGGINVVTSSIGAAHGVLAMVGVDEKDLLDIQAKLQASLAISNALTVVQNQLQKESALMIGITTIQKKAAVIAENLDTVAKGKNVVATTAATVAQKAFNLVAKANPYVLLATAILTVVGALAAFTLGMKKANNEEEEAQRRAQELREEQNRLYADYTKNVSNLKSSYMELQTQWNSLSSDQERAKWITENKDKFEELGLKVNDVKDAEAVLVTNTSTVIDAMVLRAKAAYQAAKAQAAYERALNGKIDENTRTVNEEQANWMYQKGYLGEEPAKHNGGYFAPLEAIQAYNAYIESQADMAFKQAQYPIMDLNNEADSLLGKYKKIKNEVTKPTGGDNTNKQEAARQASEKQQLWKHNEEMAKLREEAAREREDASIASIQNQAQRERAEREVQHKRTIEDLKAQQQDIYKNIYEQRKTAYERDNKDKKYENTEVGAGGWGDEGLKGRAAAVLKPVADQMANLDKLTVDEIKKIQIELNAIDLSSVFSEDEATQVKLRLDEILSKASQVNSENTRQQMEQERQRIQSLRDYLMEYGSFEEKKLALTQEYEQRIAEEQDPARQAKLQLELNEKQEELAQENAAQQIDWSGIFSELSGHTKEYLEGLRTQLQDQINSGNLSLEDMARAQEKIRDINALISEQGTFFTSLSPLQIEYNRRLAEEADARARLAAAQEKEASLEDAVSDNKSTMEQFLKDFHIEDVEVSKTMKNPFEEGTMEYDDFNKMLKELIINEGELEKAREKTSKATEEVTQAEDKNKKNKSAKQKWEDFLDNNVVKGVQTNMAEIPGVLSGLGLGDASEKAQKGLNGLNDAMGAATDFMTGNYIGALSKGISAVTNFGEAFGLWSNSNREEIERENRKLANATAVNTEAINRLTEEIKKSSPSKAYEAWEDAMELMKINEQNAMRTMENNASMYDGGHSLWYDFKYYSRNGFLGGGYDGQELLKKMYQYLGQTSLDNSYDIGSAVRDFTAEDWNRLLKEKPEWMTELGNIISEVEDSGNYNGLFKDILEFANEFGKDAYDELMNTLQESVTGVSFDSFKDKWTSMLMDLSNENKDFADDFTEQITKSFLNAQIEEKYGGRLQELYDEWADALQDDNELSNKELANLREKEEKLFAEIQDERDRIFEITGMDKSSRQQQSATANGITNISYDQADAITGILLGHTIIFEQIKAIMEGWNGGPAMSGIGEQVGSVISSGQDQTNLMRELILQNLQMMQMGFGQTFDEIRTLTIQGNSTRESILKVMKERYESFDNKLTNIYKELQAQA